MNPRLGRLPLAPLICALLALGACAPKRPSPPLPTADASEIYLFLQDSRYQAWRLWPGTDRLHEGRHPHGSYLTTYVNDRALDAIKDKEPMPPGAMIVNDNFSNQRKFISAMVMYKLPGSAPKTGDWYWAQLNADGKVRREGQLTYCLNCHQQKKSQDYLFSAD